MKYLFKVLVLTIILNESLFYFNNPNLLLGKLPVNILKKDIIEEKQKDKPVLHKKNPSRIKLKVDNISQLPELKYGCEITSLTMLLNYKGIKVDKMTLAKEMKLDKTKLQYDSKGNIKIWGNPKKGFVGSPYGNNGERGYTIYPEVLLPLIKKYYPKGGNNLSSSSLNDIETSIAKNKPVMVWVTPNFRFDIEWLVWKDSKGDSVVGTFDLHNILLTGYDKDYFYFQDPLLGHGGKVNKEIFKKSWSIMGEYALSLK